MNTNILRKAIDELAKDTPNIPYVRGMLETLHELTVPPAPTKLSEPTVSEGMAFPPVTMVSMDRLDG